MSKVNRIKEWLKIQMKNKKFVITTIVFLVLLVAVVFELTISFSGILGSTYDVDNIGKNIDKIKIGDSINYTANGYSDWEVLNINKEDNTIDIVSKTSVEDLTIKVEEVDNYYNILQNTANKYLDGKYAVSARSVRESDSKKLGIELGYWINKKVDKVLYHSAGTANNTEGYFNGYIMPVVKLNVEDSTTLNVGDIYSYSLNGVEQWVILSIEDTSSISIVPYYPIWFVYRSNDVTNFNSYIAETVEMFRDSNVISVRSISVDDRDALCNISHAFDSNYDIYTDVIYDSITIGGDNFGVVANNYVYNPVGISFGYDYCGDLNSPSISMTAGWTGGFVPIVTLKYDSPEKNIKDIDSKLRVGDNVKYSANGYNNWKVLNIDKYSNTVDIISGGIVKNLTLEGKDDYDNLENILQLEADKYKVGDNAISARTIRIDDFDSLKLIKDVQSAEFFLNNKKQYRKELVFDSRLNYVVAVGSYDISISSLKYEWATLGEKNLYNDNSPTAVANRIFKYTAGLRPIITLKLSEVEESNDKDVTNGDNKLIAEQNKANQSSQGLVSNEKLEKGEDNTSKEEVSDAPSGNIEDNYNKTTQEIKALSESLEVLEKNDKRFITVAITNLVSTIGVGIFSVLNKFKK